MNNLVETIQNAAPFTQGIFVMIVGLLSTFLVLLSFYGVIKLFLKVPDEKISELPK